MTFPSLPRRSSPEEDALDQALNAWANNDNHQRHSERREESPREALTSDALNFHRWADETRRSDPAAKGPAASTWNRVLRSTAQTTHRGGDMSSTTLGNDPRSAIVYDSRPYNRRGSGRYINTAAMLVIALGVAFAGAFAALQLNSPGDQEPRFAILSAIPSAEGTPAAGSATCDVKPLSTDRVMEIVKNPARFMVYGATGEVLEIPMSGSPPNAEYWEVDPDLELVGELSEPTEEQFDDASGFVNQYLNCMKSGTQAQIWTFYSPVMLQQKILAEFPVFAEESQVRERVEEMSVQPAYFAELGWEQRLARVTPWDPERMERDDARQLNPEIGIVEVNPDGQLATVQRSESSYYEFVISMGVSIKDTDGRQRVLTNGVGRSLIPMEGGGQAMIYVNVAKLRNSDGWVIIPWPSETELGLNQYD